MYACQIPSDFYGLYMVKKLTLSLLLGTWDESNFI